MYTWYLWWSCIVYLLITYLPLLDHFLTTYWPLIDHLLTAILNTNGWPSTTTDQCKWQPSTIWYFGQCVCELIPTIIEYSRPLLTTTHHYITNYYPPLLPTTIFWYNYYLLLHLIITELYSYLHTPLLYYILYYLLLPIKHHNYVINQDLI